MTPDVDVIRQALVAATELPNDYEEWVQANKAIRANAPVWLAQLCLEVERLRAELAAQPASYWDEVMKPLLNMEVERDAWRACADQLAEAGTTGDNWDEAMVVYERLKAEAES